MRRYRRWKRRPGWRRSTAMSAASGQPRSSLGLGRKEVVLNDPSSPWTFMVHARGRVEDSLAALERC